MATLHHPDKPYTRAEIALAWGTATMFRSGRQKDIVANVKDPGERIDRSGRIVKRRASRQDRNN